MLLLMIALDAKTMKLQFLMYGGLLLLLVVVVAWWWSPAIPSAPAAPSTAEYPCSRLHCPD
jgi:hypothetical protein